MSSYLQRIKKLEELKNTHTAKHITLTDDYGFILHTPSGDKVYSPCPTGIEFHKSDKRIKAIMGAFGSGKTTTNIAEVVRRAVMMPKCNDGRRKARFGFIRNTYGELESTTLASWVDWFGELGDVQSVKKPYIRYRHTFNDGNGVIELEVVFVSLDRVQNLKKFRSFEFTGIYINEATEVPQEALTQLSGRINRYPSHNACPPYYSFICMDYNPPKPGHWLYNRFEKNPKTKYEVLFKQPPGLLIDDKGVPLKDDSGEYIQNPDADNARFLGSDYYVLMANAATDFEEIKVFCLGQYGMVREGKPVYLFEYNDDIHSVEHFEPNPDLPIHFGWDYGTFWTACVLFQITPLGQVYLFKEFTGCDGGLRGMVENRLLPFLTQHYPNYKLGKSMGDPSGKSGQHGDASNCVSILKEYGIPTDIAPTNSPVKRIETVRWFLTRMIEGKPALRLSRAGCPTIREGFLSGYHFKKLRATATGDNEYAEEPNKNEFSHPHDSVQYGLMQFAPNLTLSKEKLEHQKRVFKPVRTTIYG